MHNFNISYLKNYLTHAFALITLLVAVIIFPVSQAFADNAASELPHSEAKLQGLYVDTKGDYYTALELEIEDGWHIYWRTSGEAGLPTEIKLAGVGVQSSEVLWPYPTRKVSEQYNIRLENYIYENKVVFPIKLALEGDVRSLSLKAQIEYGICRDICIPVVAELTRELTISEAVLIDEKNNLLSLIPKANASHGLTILDNSILVEREGDALHFNVSVEHGADVPPANIELFVESMHPSLDVGFMSPQSSIISDSVTEFQFDMMVFEDSFSGSVPLTITALNPPHAVELKIDKEIEIKAPAKLKGNGNAAVQQGGGASLEQALDTPLTQVEHSIWLIIVFAFVGGVILNLMPCVLPVLSIKLLGILKHQADFNAAHARLSFISTAAGIITSFAILALFVIGLKAFGVAVGWGFHFQEPYFIVIMVLVLTFFACNLWGIIEIKLPSSLTNHLGGASTKEGMLGHFLTGVLATLLATPCTAPFLGTAVGFALSQHAFYVLLIFIVMGAGMALPYFLLIYKPAWVSKLPKPGRWMLVVKSLMGVLLLITATWLITVSAGQLGDNGAKALGVAVVVIILNLIPAMWQNDNMRMLLVVSAALFALMVPEVFSRNFEQEVTEAETSTMWVAFDEAAIAKHVNEGRIVFVDVTADWCLTCKFNDLWAFSEDEVIAALSAHNVVAMRADWTNRDTEILRYLQQHQRQGIPFNVVYSQHMPEGNILPELLNTSIIIDALSTAQ